MSIQRAVFSTHRMIRNTVLIVPLFLVLVLYFLREGIVIDSLKFGHLQVQGLYLKLDNKFIANVHYLALPGGNKRLDTGEIERQLGRIKLLPRFFTSIALDDVMVMDKHYRILYRDNVFYLSSDDYEIAGTVQHQGKRIRGNIPFFYAKKQRFQWQGSYQYDYQGEALALEGHFRHQGIAGEFHITNRDNKVHFRASTQPFADIKPLLELFEANAAVREWLGDRIGAKQYQIVSAEGELERKGDRYRLIPTQVAVQATLRQPTVRFDDKLHPLVAESASVTLKNNVLYSSFVHPAYSQRSLDGSTGHLTNVFGTKSRRLHIELKAKTAYDHTIAKVLKHYGTTLPILQQNGHLRASVVIDKVLHNQKKTQIKGRVKLGKGNITFYGMPVTTRGGEISFDGQRVTLHRVDADMGWFHGVMSGSFKPKNKKVTLSVGIKKLKIGKGKHPFLWMKNKKTIPVTIDWHKKTRITIPYYKTKVVLNHTKGFRLDISDIRPLMPYLKGIPSFIKRGSVSVHTSDGKHYKFSGKATWPTSYLYDQKGTITQYPFSGTLYGTSSHVKLLGGRIVYDGAKNLVTLNHLYINAKKLLSQNGKGASTAQKVHVKGSKTLIRYDKYVLLTDRFDLRVHGKNTVFVATKDGDSVRVELNGNAIVVKASRIKAPMLRALINFGGLSGGRYSLDLHGNMKGKMHGVIRIKGGAVSRFKTYNNMIALFNTVPALASLSNPGFSQKGFEVKTGKIVFHTVSNRVYFDMIFIDGKSAAISGKGTVSTLNGAINMDLAVRTARGIGKLIGSLPIVGYILMGKDKSITTGVKVTGTLDNPKVTTNVVMETLLSPFQMIIRTLKSPAHIINK